jgi:uncharacterized protein (UPF0332 family)
LSLYGDLLAQARHLATREPQRPKQASLRRAVSSAYYALFHFLIDRAVRRLVRARDRQGLRDVLGRAFQHAAMKEAAKAFAGGTLKTQFDPALAGNAITQQLKDIADAFVRLQEARHEADYNRGRDFTRREALDAVDSAQKAVQDWEATKGTIPADAFLVALLVYGRAGR